MPNYQFRFDIKRLAKLVSILILLNQGSVWASDANVEGIKAYRAGDYAKAESMYRQALTEETSKTGLAAIYRNLVVLYEAQKRDATEFQQKADELAPTKKLQSPNTNSEQKPARKGKPSSTVLKKGIFFPIVPGAFVSPNVDILYLTLDGDHLNGTIRNIGKRKYANVKLTFRVKESFGTSAPGRRCLRVLQGCSADRNSPIFHSLTL
jgi:hypothetical protein